MPKRIVNAKIACLDFSLQKMEMKLGVQAVIIDPEPVNQMGQRESDITKLRIQKILATGTNGIPVTGGINDVSRILWRLALWQLEEFLKRDFKRIAKASVATIPPTLTNLGGGETFEDSVLGQAGENLG